MILPVMPDGRLPADFIRQALGQNPEIAVLFLAPQWTEQHTAQARDLGGQATAHLVFPLNVAACIAAIERSLSKVRMQHEVKRLTTPLAAANQETQNRVRELQVLIAVIRSVTSLMDLQQVLVRVVEAGVYLTGAEEGSLLLVDEETNELYMRAAKNFDQEFAKTFRIPAQDSLAGRCVRSGEPVLVSQRGKQKIKTTYLVQSILYVPITVRNTTIGALGVDNRIATKHFTPWHTRVLQALADAAAVSIENAKLYEALQAKVRTLEVAYARAVEADRTKTVVLEGTVGALYARLDALRTMLSTTATDGTRGQALRDVRGEIDGLADALKGLAPLPAHTGRTDPLKVTTSGR
jgi:two-component system NtrC family sensor kinase